MDDAKPTPGQQAVAALQANPPLLLKLQGRTREFMAYKNSLDAMELHIAMYLLWELRVPTECIPALVPLIDQRCFEARLESQVGDVLKKLEDDVERE